MLKNESFLREQNEQVQRDLDHVTALSKVAHENIKTIDANTVLHFYCECSDENCTQRIQLTLGAYNKLHKDRSTFTIACGHDVPSIEKVIDKQPHYWVVKKFEKPPESVDSLEPTPVDNS